MSRTIRFLLCILLPLGLVGPVLAQAAVQLEEVQVNYEYGDQITFVARFQPVSLVQEAYLFFQAEGEPSARSVLLTVAADGRTEYRHATAQEPIRPFSRIFFWYRTSLTDGGVFDSPRYFFQYEDNRYPWQVLEDEQVRVHWYGGDTQFGQQVFDGAHIALQSLGALIPLDPLHLPVDVFVYSSGVDIQETLRLGGYAWEAGHADPELGIVLVAITPEELQATPLPAQIPHELAHVLLYRMTGVGYASLPVWLTEGIASLVEQDSRADLSQVLDSAHQAGSLLPMGSLCAGLPADASNAILAYAQSASFTQYLYDVHGPAGLKSLIDSYARGESCEQGPRQAIGQPLSALDINWQQAVLGEDPPPAAVNNLLPYAVLLLLILLFPLGTLVHGWLRRAR